MRWFPKKAAGPCEGRVPPRPGGAWTRTARKLFLPALIVCWAAAAGAQKGGTEQTVAGFRVPDYDEQNNLKSVLYGDFARILPDGVIEITGLKIDFYKDGAVEMTVTSPKCLYNQKEGTARSDTDVEIRMEKLRITGNGFWWSMKLERFEIFRKARVEIEGVQEHMESGGLP